MVSQTGRKGIEIGLRGRQNRFDTKPLATAHNPHRNFTPVGYHDPPNYHTPSGLTRISTAS
jgi:hypothetical protein